MSCRSTDCSLIHPIRITTPRSCSIQVQPHLVALGDVAIIFPANHELSLPFSIFHDYCLRLYNATSQHHRIMLMRDTDDIFQVGTALRQQKHTSSCTQMKRSWFSKAATALAASGAMSACTLVSSQTTCWAPTSTVTFPWTLQPSV